MGNRGRGRHAHLLAALLLLGCPTDGLAATAPPGLAPALTAHLDGVAVNYTSTVTDPSATTLILVHSFGASLETWHDVYPPLARHFPVVRLDLKGHGFSSKPPRADYSWDEQARLVAALIARLGLKRVVLAGHSMGGGIALLACLHHQERPAAFDIAGLVLISSMGYPQEVPFFIAYLRDPVTRFFVYLATPEFRVRFVVDRVVHGPSRLSAERVQRYAYFLDRPGSRTALERASSQFIPRDIEQLAGRYRQIAVPTLLVWGEEDRIVPVEHARRFKRDLKNSRLKLLPQTGHVPQDERPERLVEEIVDFVKTLR